MLLVDLPDEILTSICSILHRPPPTIGVPSTRKEFHQHDLTSVLRVNKRFLNIACRILYTHPIVDDPHNFLLGIDSPSSSSFYKINIIRHVKTLDIQHRQSTRDADDQRGNQYVRVDLKDRLIWEGRVLEKGKEDLDNCKKAYNLLERFKENQAKIYLMPNLQMMRLGAWDQGWWIKVMKEVMFDEKRKEDRTDFRSLSGYQNMYEVIRTTHRKSFEFTALLLDFIRPKEILQYTQAGPMSFHDALYQRIPIGELSPVVISHLDFDIDRHTINLFPSIAIGSLNKWLIKCTPSPRVTEQDDEDGEGESVYIDYDGLMVTLHILLKHVSNITYPPSATPSRETILEIYDLDKLEYKEYDEQGEVTLAAGSMWIGRNEIYAYNDEDQSDWPEVLDLELNGGARRFGPWGMMEVTRKGVRFIDVRKEELSMTVKFVHSA
ncbi:uncharacterized protein L199_008530 [Kwoniella botswanensis]|uniref:uncharacterized protein n=1 Tax=Kwoniella botswanensis TaxID=1268659 RepID=UPI00315D8D4C